MLYVDPTTRNFDFTSTEQQETQASRLFLLPQPPVNLERASSSQAWRTLIQAAEAVGVLDWGDGEFEPGDTCLEEGIYRQLNYLLDEVGCNRPSFRLLVVGCGYDSLLLEAERRGAVAVGVSAWPDQVDYCNQQGANAYCCHFRDLLGATEWHGQFDGIIIHGALEQWVQPDDFLQGQSDSIYRQAFEIAAKLLDPEVADPRCVTTAIHTTIPTCEQDLLTPWYQQPRGTIGRHLSLLRQSRGGIYPAAGQLEACAAPWFSLTAEGNGTQGYQIANDYRMTTLARGLRRHPRAAARVVRALLRHPWQTMAMLRCYFLEKSWDWQFQGAQPPMQLLRQTWQVQR